VTEEAKSKGREEIKEDSTEGRKEGEAEAEGKRYYAPNIFVKSTPTTTFTVVSSSEDVSTMKRMLRKLTNSQILAHLA
jgi:hypothetical protein